MTQNTAIRAPARYADQGKNRDTRITALGVVKLRRACRHLFAAGDMEAFDWLTAFAGARMWDYFAQPDQDMYSLVADVFTQVESACRWDERNKVSHTGRVVDEILGTYL